MFRKLFNKHKENNVETVDISVCQYQSDLEECNLIHQLKEKQSQLKELDNEIRKYKNGSIETIPHFINFLMLLGEHTDLMNYHYDEHHGKVRNYFSRHGTYDLEKILHILSLDDIDMIATDLKMLKTKSKIMSEKQSISRVLEKDIDKIKVKLGIM